MSIPEYAAAMKAVLFVEKQKNGGVKKQGITKGDTIDLRNLINKHKAKEQDVDG